MDRIEIIVVDGMSEDGTRDIVKHYIEMRPENRPKIKLLDNPKQITPCALNIGIKAALGDPIIRMDAHAEYAGNYISKSIEHSPDVDNVGGLRGDFSREKTLTGKAITLTQISKFGPGREPNTAGNDLIMSIGAHSTWSRNHISKCVEHLNNQGVGCVGGMIKTDETTQTIARSDIFGIGKSPYRTGADKPQIVDTVFGGCYKREVFEKIGLFNEALVRGQDLEFNLRLKKAGMKTLLIPEIVSFYYARSDFWPWIKHNFQDGKWITLSCKYSDSSITLRHLVPLVFILTLPISIWPYIPVNLFRSIQLAIKYREWKYLFAMPFMFFVLHLSYGVGSLWGLIKSLFISVAQVPSTQ